MFTGTTITPAVFILLPLTLHLAAAGTHIDDYAVLSCKTVTTSDLFSADSTVYASNLNKLLTSLSANVSSSRTGFAKSTVGSTSSTTVYGLALCRGDSSAQNCTDCVSGALDTLRANCSGTREAIFWQEWCMLRYANRDIFSSMESDPAFTLNNVNTLNRSDWRRALESTMSDATQTAAGGTEKFATNEAQYTAHQQIYSLAQCTPDLTAGDCSKCFKAAIDKLPVRNQAGVVLLPSCILRYQLDPFYNTSTVPALSPAPTQKRAPAPTHVPVPEPTPAPVGNGGRGTADIPRVAPTPIHHGKPVSRVVKIVWITAAAVVILGILGALVWYHKRRVNPSRDVDMKRKPGVESSQMDSTQVSVDIPNSAPDKELPLDSSQDIGNQRVPNSDLDSENGEGETEEEGKEEESDRSKSRKRRRRRRNVKTEAAMITNLQHRNVAKLRFSQKDQEEFLVHEEDLPYKSLDTVLFDPIKRASLDWGKRFNIICGVAKGLLYLHHDSRMRIVHRDLKPSNILLDKDMNPQISGFGKARKLELDHTRASIDKHAAIAGTTEYMAPEYKRNGQYSFKSDIYSFGIIVLEIVTGLRSHDRPLPDESMLHRIWRLWSENKKLEIIDPELKDYSIEEVGKCIDIGLLCIQEDAEKRPTMTSIQAALIGIGKSTDLPQATRPTPHNTS